MPRSETTTIASNSAAKSSIDSYLRSIDKALQDGNATEHTHRPALKAFLESLDPRITATNEPQRIACGSPDFIVTRKTTPIGYVEAKDVGTDLDRVQETPQLQRYRASLGNLILTDYLQFRLFRSGEHVATVRLASELKNGKLRRESDSFEETERLLKSFLAANVPVITTSRELAERMARIARLIHDLIRQVFALEDKRGDLHGQYDAFRKVLIEDLSVDQFADMYAQTIAYGMFAARCNHAGPGFVREHAGKELPKTNPFLRKLFNTIAGADLDDRISWAVDDLVELLARADMGAILEDFGRATRQEDPVVHFYETFLAAYDPKMREARGVYYTPEPVVSYIVRSVDAILRRDFKLKDGLADSSQVKLKLPTQTGRHSKEVVTHKVQILDPACGTGTFLYSVISLIGDSFRASKGLWPPYVAKDLLPRLYGFELLMAPYAVAHMKLGLQLRESGYDFAADERLRVFLTNSLEEAHEFAGLPLFATWLADEAAAASEVKRDVPIMVVLGNPPYSNFGQMNRGEWILDQLRAYKQGLKEKKLNLDDDFIKFIRFGQWRIEKTGYGILAYITNHTYLAGLTHRRMRESLLETFDDIYVLDLHGNAKKRERAPGGGKDENVFDIQQGVAIAIFVRRSGGRKTRGVYHADLWGSREGKYAHLQSHDVTNTEWRELTPEGPAFYLAPQPFPHATEYQSWWSITDVFTLKQNGIKTDRDELFYEFDRESLEKRMKTFYSEEGLDPRFRERYNVNDSSSYDLLDRRARTDFAPDAIQKCLYRPFDYRWLYYVPGLTSRPAWDVMRHMLAGENTALICLRQSRRGEVGAQFIGSGLIGKDAISLFDIGTVFPLYVYPDADGLFRQRQANLSKDFVADVSTRLNLRFIQDAGGDCVKTFGPDDVLHYTYAIFHSTEYRQRYAPALNVDFPRIPLTSDRRLFRALVKFGRQLAALHLIQTNASRIPTFPMPGNNLVTDVQYRGGRVYINDKQYFDGVSESAWGLQIGGYQVADRWLKDRKGRELVFEDLNRYMRIIGALAETVRLQGEIDDAIPKWPIQ